MAGGTISYQNRFPLPDDWNVEGFICCTVPIPNDPQYIAIFRGLLDTLTWQRSFMLHPTENAAFQVSKTWEAAFASKELVFTDCEGNIVDVRQNEEQPCTLEKTFDDGETWEAWANLQLCPPLVKISPTDGTVWWYNPTGDPAGPPGSHTSTGAWEPAPVTGVGAELEPATPSPFPPGSSVFEDGLGQCTAAANLAAELQKGTTDLVALIVGVEDFLLLAIIAVGALVVLAGPLGIMALGLAIMGLVPLIEIDMIEADLAELDFTEIRDIAYCYFDTQGRMNERDRQLFIDRLYDHFKDVYGEVTPGTIDQQAAELVMVILRNVSAEGLTNSATVTQSSIDVNCEAAECLWYHKFDAAHGWGNWEPYDTPSLTPNLVGNLVLGSWQTEYATFAGGGRGQYCHIKLPLGIDAHLVKIRYTYQILVERTGYYTYLQWQLDGGTLNAIVAADPDGNDTVGTYTVTSNFSEVMDTLYWAHKNLPELGDSSFPDLLLSFEVWGDGDEPTW